MINLRLTKGEASFLVIILKLYLQYMDGLLELFEESRIREIIKELEQ